MGFLKRIETGFEKAKKIQKKVRQFQDEKRTKDLERLKKTKEFLKAKGAVQAERTKIAKLKAQQSKAKNQNLRGFAPDFGGVTPKGKKNKPNNFFI